MHFRRNLDTTPILKPACSYEWLNRLNRFDYCLSVAKRWRLIDVQVGHILEITITFSVLLQFFFLPQPFESVNCIVLVDPCVVEDPLLELLGLCLNITFPIFAVASVSAVVLLLAVLLFSHAKYPSAGAHSPPLILLLPPPLPQPVGVLPPSPGLFGGTLTLATLLPNVRERWWCLLRSSTIDGNSSREFKPVQSSSSSASGPGIRQPPTPSKSRVVAALVEV